MSKREAGRNLRWAAKNYAACILRGGRIQGGYDGKLTEAQEHEARADVDAVSPVRWILARAMLATIDALRTELAAEREQRKALTKALTKRLVEYANEEPPSGWLRPGEDGYENTPEGATSRAEKAEAEVARLTAECAAMRNALEWYSRCSSHTQCPGTDVSRRGLAQEVAR